LEHFMRIATGADHGGFELKVQIVEHLREMGHEVEDFGTTGPESVDYPDYARPVSRAVAAGEYDCGILICGTGIGIGIAANKVPGIRAAVCTETYSARMSRLHNDANILCLGGRVVGVGLAFDIVDIWLTTVFEGGRHARRVGKIHQIEDETDS
jgi:ribose 5-phosphate isomerase B